MLSAAAAIESLGYELYFAWDSLEAIHRLTSLLDITLSSPQLDPAVLPHYASRNPLAMERVTRGYDLVLYLSDGSIPLLGGKKNLLHMQVPFHGVHGRSFANRLKLMRISAVIVNSRFTQSVVDKEYGIHTVVVYPPVMPVPPGRKEKLILSVGRFEPSLNVKRQDALIEAFRLAAPDLPGWRLVLVGGSDDESWLSQLKSQALGLPIEFVTNAPYSVLCALYRKAKIYWHAAGYQVDEQIYPEQTEHFGISTVEAISAGCLPLVVGKGGQREILADPIYYWSSVAELAEKTVSAVGGSIPLPAIDTVAFTGDNLKKNLEALLT